jgi:hypothetical protein
MVIGWYGRDESSEIVFTAQDYIHHLEDRNECELSVMDELVGKTVLTNRDRF